MPARRKDGAVERVVAGDRAGVRSRRHRRTRGAPRLDDDDRFRLGEVTRRAHELARVGDRLDVQDDRARVRVGAEVIDQVAEVDVAHRADRDERREADLVGGRPVEDGYAEGAGLAEERDAAGRRDDVGEGDVEIERRADVAEAVGADDAQAVRVGDREHFVFELLARRADLLEPGRDDDGAGDSGLAALTHDRGHGLGGHGDHGEIDLARHLGDRRVSLDALDGRCRHVDGVHDAVVFGADQVAQQDVADGALLVGGADDGDRLRLEQLVKIVCAHVPSRPESRLLVEPAGGATVAVRVSDCTSLRLSGRGFTSGGGPQ